jgi:hypothetical protein
MWVHRCACVVLLVGFHVHRFWRGVLEADGKQFLDGYFYFHLAYAGSKRIYNCSSNNLSRACLRHVS